MKYLVAVAVILVCGVFVLWREVRTPSAVVSPATRTRHAESARTPVTSPRAEPVTSVAVPATPPGGVRTWSPSAAPIDGPDPFALVPAVRTADDAHAGLAIEGHARRESD